MTELAPRLGGLVEFYRSPDRVRWTPTGINVPDYPKLAQLWWKHVGTATAGEKTPQEAMDALAADQDRILQRLERADLGPCGPKLNEERTASYWLNRSGAPKQQLADEKPQGKTIAYTKLIANWRKGKSVLD